MAEKKQVKWGVSNVKIQALDADGFVKGNVLEVPGTTQIEFNIDQSSESISADNIANYIALPSEITSFGVTWSNFNFSDEVEEILFGYIHKAGLSLMTVENKPQPVAMAFDTRLFDGTQYHTYRVGLLHGIFQYPNSSFKTAGSDAPDAAQVEGKFSPRKIADGVTVYRVSGQVDDGTFKEDTFNKLVFPTNQGDLDAGYQAFNASSTSSEPSH